MPTLTTDQQQVWNRLSDQPGNYYSQVDEDERQKFRDFFKSILHDGEVTVEFQKSDGTTRVMICTLNEDKGAKYIVNESKGDATEKRAKKPNPDVCAVWDCEQQAWRSFRWDRLKRIEFSIG